MVKESFAAGRLSVIGEELLGDEKKKQKWNRVQRPKMYVFFHTHSYIIMYFYVLVLL